MSRLPNSDRPNPWFWGAVLVVVVASVISYYHSKPEKLPASVPVAKTNAVQPAEVPVVETNNTVVEQSAAVAEISAPVAQEVTTNTNNVPEGYKRVKFSVVGTGFATQPQTNHNQVNR